MKKTLVFFVTYQLLCARIVISAEQSKWVIATDFEPGELANLKQDEDHQLLLKALSSKDSEILTGAFFFEIMAKGIGNEFFGLVADKNVDRENTAIAKAVFDCFTKLQIQDRAALALQSAATNAKAYLSETGDIGEAFSRVCSQIDHDLGNETIYTVLRDEYKRSNSYRPKKTYQYAIPQTENDFRKGFAELINDPKMKKFSAHLTWIAFFNNDAEKLTKESVLELARVPGKLEAIQKIYDESIDELTYQVENVPLDRIDISDTPVQMNLDYLRPVLTQKLLEKIKANSELESTFQHTSKHRIQRR